MNMQILYLYLSPFSWTMLKMTFSDCRYCTCPFSWFHELLQFIDKDNVSSLLNRNQHDFGRRIYIPLSFAGLKWVSLSIMVFLLCLSWVWPQCFSMTRRATYDELLSYSKLYRSRRILMSNVWCVWRNDVDWIKAVSFFSTNVTINRYHA